jgi:hypothetical protein
MRATTVTKLEIGFQSVRTLGQLEAAVATCCTHGRLLDGE